MGCIIAIDCRTRVRETGTSQTVYICQTLIVLESVVGLEFVHLDETIQRYRIIYFYRFNLLFLWFRSFAMLTALRES